jgi:hypothetical protein
VRQQRPTIDVVLLLIAGTVCFTVLSSVTVVLIKQFTDPDGPTGFSAIADVVNTLISLLAGFLAGRSESAVRRNPPEKDEP